MIIFNLKKNITIKFECIYVDDYTVLEPTKYYFILARCINDHIINCNNRIDIDFSK